MRNRIAQRRFEEDITSTSGPQSQVAVARPSNQQRGATGVALARHTHNPYAKKSQNGNRSKGGSGNDKHNNKRTNMANHTSSTLTHPRHQQARQHSYQNQQHPHRVGRVRVDRQFSTNLEILAGDETQDEKHEPPSRRSLASDNNGAENSTANHTGQSFSLFEDSDEDDALLENPF